MKAEQITAVQNYLRGRFGNESIELKGRAMGKTQIDDSVEVYMDGEILGLLYVDDEDPDDVSYDLNVSILSEDLG